ncbi:non-ribosomal peptide synthetase [Janthinobacterium lividum]|uniref:non-ribosomal peptide synthetase n=1 Tax=Janthinobacterium lividum TaxID=29581 RepID=UPI001595CADB|nr:non-ribosomal peptide synthetase [Janthinobacterium lividum]QKY12014.1 amino acid adenylation domain-containing protein [Janthinobacterium lividum]
MSDSVKPDLEFLKREYLRRKLMKTAAPLASSSTVSPIEVADRHQPLPLSWAQQRLLFLDQLDHAAGVAYNMAAGMRLSGVLDHAALITTLNTIVARHESLRTSFAVAGDHAEQRIAASDSGFLLYQHELSTLSERDRRVAIEHISAEEAAAPFDLATGPLIRGRLLRLDAHEHILLITQHHIISDGWSIGVLVREVCTLYTAFSQGQADPLPALAIQYPDYAVWQRQWLQGERLTGQLAFWKAHLEGAPSVVTLPTDHPRPAVQNYAGANVPFLLSAELSARLRALGHRHGTTLFMTLLAGWSILLARMSGQSEIVVGCPIANRQRAEMEAMIGLFTNTLALRVNLESNPSVSELLAQVKATTLGGYAHQDVPFEQVVNALKPVRNTSHSPIFQVVLSLDNTPDGGSGLTLPGLTLSGIDKVQTTTAFELALSLADNGVVIKGNLTYSASLFEQASVLRLLGHFETLLGAMVEQPEQAVNALALLTLPQRAYVVQDVNRTEADYPREQLIDQLFEAQARARPEALALVYGGQSLTYGELNRRANQVAHLLLGMGIQPDDRVALCAERSVELVVGMLGILKAGGAYVPLDPGYPAARLSKMLADSAPVALLTQAALEDDLPALSLMRVVVLDGEEARAQLSRQPEQDPAPRARHAGNLAYIIYTSGSSGVPKGVMIEHRNVLRLVMNSGFAPLGEDDCVAHCASPAFDAATWEIWGALLNGARVLVMPHAVLLDPPALNRALLDGGVTAMWLTVGLFNSYLNALETAFGTLRYLLVGGDALDPAAIDRLLQRRQRPQHLINGYGPTETTTFAATFPITAVAPGAVSVPIGLPIANTQIYLLDSHMAPVPLGVTGELYIGGDGVGRGYLNQPELTAERFVDDPFSQQPGARLYRSGDLARRLQDGTIDYQGRNDQQVKLRGYRIELGEIETRLKACDDVRDAIVLIQQEADGDKRLVAYVVPEEGALLDADYLRGQLGANLATYMVPSAFISLAAFPLTPNGKVDRKALPVSGLAALAGAAYAAPQSVTEQQVAAIWQELLGVPQVGRNDHFFDLGGHSLLAVQVISRLRQTLRLEVELRELFAAPTLAGFAAAVDSGGTAVCSAITPADRSQSLPLSWAQQRLWFLDQLDHAAGAAYHMPAALRLTGMLDRNALRQTLDTIVARHESLRTRFHMDGDNAVQAIAPPDSGFQLHEQELSAFTGEALQSTLERIATEEARAPFDLASGPLIRGRLLHLAEQEHILLITQHHIISDGWSIGVLVREVCTLYAAFSQGQANPLAPLPLQYADYAVWQRGWLTGDLLEAQKAFWTSHLHGVPALLTLPTDRPRPAIQTYTGSRVPVSLSPSLSAQLRSLSQSQGTTLFMTLLAGWSVLLGRLSGQDDIVVGCPVANRQRSETEGMIGFFVNTLALRVQLADAPSVRELLAQVKRTTLDGYAHQDLPFEQVVEAVKPLRNTSHSPIFQVLLSLNNTPDGGDSLQLPGLTVSKVDQADLTTQFELALSLMDNGVSISGGLTYSDSLFDAATISRLLAHFDTLLGAMAANPDLPVNQLSLLTPQQRTQLLTEFNPPATAAVPYQLIHQRFEAHAAQRPDAIALTCGSQNMSYAELNRRANQFAHRLLALGIAPDDKVALCAERGMELVVGVLAILKAGGAYVPMDLSYPPERIAHMLADCAPVAVLTQTALQERFATTLLPLLMLDEACGMQPDSNPEAAALGEHHLAYVIYTSGSTGLPKGVMVEHGNVARLLTATHDWFEFGASDVWSLFHSIAFDFSVWELWGALAYGGRLVVVPADCARSPQAFYRLLCHEGVTVLNQTPSAFRQLIAAQREVARPHVLRQIIFGGEALELHTLAPWIAANPDTCLVNMYGITEITVHATYRVIRQADIAARAGSLIGRAIPDLRLYVLDADMQPVPIGVTGELYIGGAGVARGYLNRPELTMQRFVNDPYGGGRLYRSGDLGRWLADGSLEYLGRNDFQVKIRGYRIELGEIEAELARCDGVREAVVTARSAGSDSDTARLVAYLQVQEGAAPSVDALRHTLSQVLPDYMLPSAFVIVDTFPLTANGKLDLQALPAPDQESVLTREYEAPQGAAEVALAEIWQALLGVQRIGRHDHFFELGGHSLLAVQVVSRLRQRLAVEVDLRDLFASPILASFARVIEGAGRPTPDAIIPADRSVPLPMSWAQQRLWFLDQLDHTASLAYHISAGLRLKGCLNRGALQAALDCIVARHESLRTCFVMQGSTAVQVIAAPECGFLMQQHELGALFGHELQFAIERISVDEAGAPFDLSTGPLVRGRLLRLSDDEHILLITQHHITSDAWSTGVLVREVCALYTAFSQGLGNPLPALAVQYPDYAAWQRQWLQGDLLEQQIAYWKAHLTGAPALLALPTDRPRPAVQGYTGGRARMTLSAELSSGLRALSQRHGVTLFMTLLTGWSVLMARLSGQTDIVVGCPVANRQRGETEGMIGFFVNTLALRVSLENNPSVSSLLAQVKRITLDGYAHQDVPFEQVVEAIKPPRNTSHSPLFQVVLSLNNTPEGGDELTLPGLTLSGIEQTHATTQFDLSMSMADSGARISASLTYSDILFDAASITRLLGHFETLLGAMVEQPEQAVNALALLTLPQRAYVVQDVNRTEAAYPREQLIDQLFEAQARARPEALALVYGGQSLTYGELNRRANQVAHLLLGMGIQPDDRVALCAERSVELVVGMLGILKAGGAYVPLDPGYPAARLSKMLADSAPVALLTQAALEDDLPALSLMRVVVLDGEQAQAQLARQPEQDPVPRARHAGNLAYIIYTSGSSGVPKGVMIEHRNVLRLVMNSGFAPLGEDDCVAHCASPAFDAATWEIWGALLSGARLLVVPQETLLTPPAFNDSLIAAGVTALFLTTGLFNEYLDAISPALGQLRYLLTGGEAIDTRSVARLLAKPQRPQHVLHVYGPTETTTFATYFAISEVPAGAISLPIGLPIGNTTVYVLDTYGQPVPLGVKGEVYIGGDGVGRGYLNQPELTAERFVADPFSQQPGARLYRSGDMARRLADGNVEYQTRNDDQVKIRGYRIELGEIETRLKACDDVRDVVVMVHQESDGDKRLVAYVVPEEGCALHADLLRRQLSETLAAYMVPGTFVSVDTFPLTPNGKVDRKALPALGVAVTSSAAYLAPQGATEGLLADIWQYLLGVAQVGRQDHFFDLGGHSLLAVQVISRLRQELGVEVALRELFAAPTLAGFAAVVDSAVASDMGAILPADRSQPLSLSWAQQRLWFLDQLDHAASSAYHMPFGFRLTGMLDGSALQATLDALVARHESLRTRFIMDGGQPVQKIGPVDSGFQLHRHELRALPDPEQQSAIARISAEEAAAPFDLATGPLIRGRLLRLGEQEHVLLVTKHHIVSDGWSIGVLMREVCALYTAFSQGLANPLAPLAIQYADYAVWQRAWLQGEALQKQLAFWKTHLDGAPVLLEMPTDRPRPALQSYAGASLAVYLDDVLTADLRALSQRSGTTLFMTLLAGWAILLARMSGQDDIVIGSPIANRQRSETEHLIGFFVNTLALRVRIDGDLRLEQLLQQVKATLLDAYSHQDLPFEQVVEAMNPVRSLAHSPVFQTMMALNNTPARDDLALPGLTLHGLDHEQSYAQFDLSLALTEAGNRISGNIEYASDLFDAATIERLAQQYLMLLASMAKGPQQCVSRLELLMPADRQRVLYDYNTHAAAYPQDQLMHQLFEAQAAAQADATAVEHAGTRLSYGALNARANQLAHALLALGIVPDDRVAICAGRGIDMIVAMLGVLKAGAAYVPLDPAYPDQRLAYMLGDCAPAALLVDAALAPRLAAGAVPVLALQAASLAQQPVHNPLAGELGLQSGHLAYVIYTSGSTGLPKGVLLEHRQAVNFIHGQSGMLQLSPADRVLQFASFGFDSSVAEIFPALSVGATVVMRTEELMAPDHAFLAFLAAQRITVADLPTAFWHQWVQEVAHGRAMPPATLRTLVVSGEPAERRHLVTWLGTPGTQGCRWINNYGPTEATVNATSIAYDAASCLPEGPVPIGRPVANAQVYVLDAQRQPVPPGVVGELYIGGAGVARGYLNRPELTAQRFIADPFSSDPAARLYRTGDLGRWLADGTLAYHGRNDFQVKLRGFRIELGEIEAQLVQCAGVREAVVLARTEETQEVRLVAYVVAEAGQVLAVEPLRAQLAQSLAAYMVPGAFVLLDALPLTPNGKLDRRALPAPDQAAVPSRAYAAPEGDTEVLVAQIWQELLGVERVGRHDHFFELGGHSLLAMRMLSRVREQLGAEVAVRELFKTPVLAGFASAVADAGESALSAIMPADRSGPLPLSWAQQRLWFLDQLDHAASAAYHMAAGFRLSGTLDRAALQATFDCIVARHESLRTRFILRDGVAVQEVAAPDTGLPLHLHVLDGLHGHELQSAIERIGTDEASTPFDLAQGPLIRGRLLRLGEQEHILFITQHHIISDGWSIGVLVREVCTLYAAFSQGQANPLPALAIQYPDYAAWQRQWLQGEALQAQLAFWRAHLHGAPALLAIPTDRPRPARQSHAGETVRISLDAPLTAGVRSLGQQHGTTLFMSMLAAWSLLLSRLSGQDDVVIGSPIANRQRGETEGLIGFFANTLALRVQLQDDPTVAAVLAQVKATTLAAYAHQDLPFEQVVEAVNPARSMAHSPLFQAMLTLDNTPGGGQLALPGLQVQAVAQAHTSALCDLMLTLSEQGETLGVHLTYASDLYDGATMLRLLGYLQTLLASMVRSPQCRLSELTLLGAEERAQLLALNPAPVAYPQQHLVHQLFARQAAAQPEAVALRFAGQSLSYAALNRRANQLAHALLARGVQRDARVAICSERSVEMVVAILAVLKAGAAYVPLDPAYPRERLAYMYADSAPALLLTQSWLQHGLPAGAQTLYLDQVQQFEEQPQHDPAIAGLNTGDLAYVIYTSGSTGRPKGVMIEHGNVLNLVHWALDSFEREELAATVLSTSINFDLSVYELFAPLACGASVTLVQDILAAPAALVGSSLINTVPSAAQALLGMGGIPASVRSLNVAGEPLKRQLAERLLNETAVERLCNLYGPTETTTYSTWVRMDRGTQFVAHIGVPVANTQVYILDGALGLQPLGVVGEIYIGGAGVTRGYLNQEELTQARYVPDPFSALAGARLYKTGDLGRWLADGNIEYLGRNDFQVKVRGFRIELGEIEAALLGCAGVREAVVLARTEETQEVRLVAYVVAEAGQVLAVEPLRGQLAQTLAAYMVPGAFVLLDALPLTPNGKLDREALPAPDLSAVHTCDYAAPEGETEVLVAQIWQELLGVERVGRQDDFFALGGHSLLAVQVISRLRERLGVEVAIRTLFNDPTLSRFASAVADAGASELSAIVPADRSGPLPLSWAQQRLWFLDQLDHAASAAYHMAAGFRLSGMLDRAALQATFDCIVARHESLRTRFILRDGVAVQEVAAPDTGLPLHLHVLDGLHGHELQSAIERIGTDEASTPFDLAQGPLIRGRLLRLGEQEHILFITQHHIISDGWSIGVLVREVCTLYAAFSQGQANPLPALAIQYPDYAAWQRQWLQGEALQAQLAFWRTHLQGAPALLAIPTDRPRPARQSHAGETVRISLDAPLTAGVRSLGQQHGTTLFMSMLAAWSLLLSRLSGQDDVVIGSPIANRQRGETEGLIGFFANTLALRVQLQDDPTVAAVLAQVKATTLAAYAHQDLPFEQVVEAVNPARSMAHSPLFQAMLTLDNTPGGGQLALPGLQVQAVAQAHTSALCDLMLTLSEQGETLGVHLTYASDLYDGATMLRLLGYLQTLLASMVRSPQCRLSELTLLGAEERAQLLALNPAPVAYPQQHLVHQLFARQAAAQPEAVALRFAGQSLSYAALNRRANQLAHALLARGVQRDARVAICSERSVEMVVAILAVLKAGAAYVPLDPAYPRERLAYMYADSAPALLLTQSWLQHGLPAGAQTLYLDQVQQFEEQPQHDPAIAGLNTGDLAYVIYTSGSTGRPKGVMIEHGNVLNLVHWALDSFEWEELAATVLSTSINFDLSVYELFAPLACGASVTLVQDILAAPAALVGSSLINTVPSAAQALLGMGGIPASVRSLNVAGEPLKRQLAERLLNETAVERLCNLYGPTETTTYSTWVRMDRGTQFVAHIGVPVANTQVYILDGALGLQPLGVVGEIYIGGAGVTRGYLNQEELTRARYVPDPFSALAGARLYKTGDLGRWLADGNIEYLGRNDFQVKVRGFRIELGEIEAALLGCAGVREAVVLARTEEAQEVRLVAYVVAEAGQVLAVEPLRAQLAQSLAAYMVPGAFVLLDALPLTPNGKLDREALPAPDLSAVHTCDYAAPEGDTEVLVAQIWQELLGVERVGRQDDFFALGGHSILAVTLMSRINRACGMEVPLRALFAQSTLQGFAQSINIQASSSAAEHSNLHAIRADGKMTPLFLIHPGEGEIGYARALSKWIDADIPVYGLAASGFLPGERASTLVEEMAAHYLAQVRKVQPHGPYRLAGWSAGGSIAYEMANQLAGADEVVEFLGLMDTRSDYLAKPSGSSPDRQIISEAQFLFDAIPAAKSIEVELQLRQLLDKQDVTGMIACCQANGLLPNSLDAESLSRHLAVRYGIHLALCGYAPQAIPTPVMLFVATDEVHTDPTLGWQAVTHGRLQRYAVPGNHYSMMDMPHVETLAKQLSLAMAEAALKVILPAEQRYAARMCIQSGAPKAPTLFCVPGAGGSITAFTHLAQALGGEWQIQGLQPRGLCGTMVPHTDVASAAACYVRAIREIVPTGPYHVVGHSFGGWVACEIARQLLEQGEQVGSLIVLDSRAPVSPQGKRKFYSRVDMLMHLMGLYELNLGSSMGLRAEDLIGLAPDAQISLMLARLIEHKVFPARTGIAALRAIVRVFAANLNESYQPSEPYAHGMHLVIASDPAQAERQRADYRSELVERWRAWAPKVQVWESPGDHFSLLSPPCVQDLAAWLRMTLNRTANGNAPLGDASVGGSEVY